MDICGGINDLEFLLMLPEENANKIISTCKEYEILSNN